MKNIPKHKWILISCGIALAILGLVLINVNKYAKDYLSVIVGSVMLIIGVIRLVYGIVVCLKEKDFYYQVIFGGISIIFGIVFVIFRMDSVLFFVLFSICILAEAITECATGVGKAYEEISGIGMIVVGIIKLIFGVAIMIRPVGDTTLWVIFVGIYFVLYAATMILVTINIKHHDESKDDKSAEELNS